MIPVPGGEKGGAASNGEAVPPVRNMGTSLSAVLIEDEQIL